MALSAETIALSPNTIELLADAIALSVETMALLADAIALSVETMALLVKTIALQIDKKTRLQSNFLKLRITNYELLCKMQASTKDYGA